MWRQVLGDQEALVGAEPAGQRPLQLRELRPQLPLGQLRQRRRVRVARPTSAASISRPDMPRMSVATAASLMFAPSSVFCSRLTSAAALPDQRRPVARQLAQLPLRAVRHEAGLQQPMPQQVGAATRCPGRRSSAPAPP